VKDSSFILTLLPRVSNEYMLRVSKGQSDASKKTISILL